MIIKITYYVYNKSVFLAGRIRALFWSLFMKKVGDNTSILNSVKILNPKNIEIGNNVCINDYCYISGEGGVTIGDYTQIAPGVSIVSIDHGFSEKNKPFVLQKLTLKPIVIGYNVWIGKNSIILKGVTVGENSIVAAGSVVTKDIPPNSIYGGNPAKFIKNI